MAASYETVRQILTIMRRHVTEEQLRAISHDLRRADGNASFRETMRRIAEELEPAVNSARKMQHREFAIGKEFTTCGGLLRWRCTDIGTRTVLAIKLGEHPDDWYKGPPYAVTEHVFDEDDLAGCEAT